MVYKDIGAFLSSCTGKALSSVLQEGCMPVGEIPGESCKNDQRFRKPVLQ